MNRSLLLTLCLASATCLGADNGLATGRQLKDTACAVLNHQHVQAALAYARNTANKVITYAKENPGKTAFMAIGASYLTLVACIATWYLRQAIKRYQATHTTFCNCCGRKIAQKEIKYKDTDAKPDYITYYGDGTECGCYLSDYYLCEACHARIAGKTNNAWQAYRRAFNS